MPMNSHFPRCPFDRDTLLLQAYNINFLFVFASYVNNADSKSVRTRIHDRFRSDLIRVFYIYQQDVSPRNSRFYMVRI